MSRFAVAFGHRRKGALCSAVVMVVNARHDNEAVGRALERYQARFGKRDHSSFVTTKLAAGDRYVASAAYPSDIGRKFTCDALALGGKTAHEAEFEVRETLRDWKHPAADIGAVEYRVEKAADLENGSKLHGSHRRR